MVLSPISMYSLTLDHITCLHTYGIKHRKPVLLSCIPGSQRKGCLMLAVAQRPPTDVRYKVQTGSRWPDSDRRGVRTREHKAGRGSSFSRPGAELPGPWLGWIVLEHCQAGTRLQDPAAPGNRVLGIALLNGWEGWHRAKQGASWGGWGGISQATWRGGQPGVHIPPTPAQRAATLCEAWLQVGLVGTASTHPCNRLSVCTQLWGRLRNRGRWEVLQGEGRTG